ncbi:hypothetical protein ABI59_09750 [Acidobacteria bacterium Mor1]|nr:hypothetical protein ABI59_09750 [Acidobacteria bacterium Mor1]
MNRREREELLWELADTVPDRQTRPIPPEILRAFCRGALSERERTRIEWILCRSSAARADLFQALGKPIGVPPAWVGKALRGEPVQRASPPRPLRRWLPMAAAAALALLALIWLRPVPDLGAPGEASSFRPATTYEVRIQGASEIRSETTESMAYPETRLRVWVEPADRSGGAVRFALYREESGALRRVQRSELLEERIERGAALFEARAETLLGSHPGRKSLFVVVAEPGATLPEKVALDGLPPVSRLETETGGAVYPRSIRIVAGPQNHELEEE